jgi:hypothetical protein
VQLFSVFKKLWFRGGGKMNPKRMMASVPDALIWTFLFAVLYGFGKSIGIAIFILSFLLVQYFKRWRPKKVVKKTISEQFKDQFLKLEENEKNKFLNILNPNQRYQYEQFINANSLEEKERLFQVMRRMNLTDKFYKWTKMVGIAVTDVTINDTEKINKQEKQ